MTPISTAYCGHLFRSRLEARWAVFFDALGMPWEYEPQGFRLSNGAMYLPDFRLSGVDTNGDKFLFWVEVKPEHGDDKGEDKARQFAKEFAQSNVDAYTKGVLVVRGLPTKGFYDDLSNPHFSWTLWSKRRRPWFEVDGNRDYWGWLDKERLGYQNIDCNRIAGNDPHIDIRHAVMRASFARFEHGQTPDCLCKGGAK